METIVKYYKTNRLAPYGKPIIVVAAGLQANERVIEFYIFLMDNEKSLMARAVHVYEKTIDLPHRGVFELNADFLIDLGREMAEEAINMRLIQNDNRFIDVYRLEEIKNNDSANLYLLVQHGEAIRLMEEATKFGEISTLAWKLRSLRKAREIDLIASN